MNTPARLIHQSLITADCNAVTVANLDSSAYLSPCIRLKSSLITDSSGRKSLFCVIIDKESVRSMYLSMSDRHEKHKAFREVQEELRKAATEIRSLGTSGGPVTNKIVVDYLRKAKQEKEDKAK